MHAIISGFMDRGRVRKVHQPRRPQGRANCVVDKRRLAMGSAGMVSVLIFVMLLVMCLCEYSVAHLAE